jgi:hypothetical protein
MAYERIRDLPQITEPICVHLRTKAMIVEGILDASQLDGRHHHQACWCNLTQRPKGPDDGHVELLGCTPSRSCYCATR